MDPWRSDLPSVAPFGIGNGVAALIDQGLIETIAAQAFPSKLVVAALHAEFCMVKLSLWFREWLGGQRMYGLGRTQSWNQAVEVVGSHVQATVEVRHFDWQ